MRTAGLVALSGLGRYLFATHREKYLYIARIAFPNELAMSDYWRERARWMDTEKFENIITSLTSNGQMLDASHEIDLSNSQITYSFSFRTTTDRDAFVTIVNSQSAVNKASLLAMGYQFDRQYVTVPA